MISRTLYRLFSTQHKHLNKTEIVANMAELRKTIKTEQEQNNLLKQELEAKQKQNVQKNKKIHQQRIKLTQDVNKTSKIWEDAKKKSEVNKNNAVKAFANHLVDLGSHQLDLKQGFDNTMRLFYSTLEKFKIKQSDLKIGTKIKKQQVEVVGSQTNEKPQLKQTIAKIVQKGWQLQGKIIRKAKVILYQ